MADPVSIPTPTRQVPSMSPRNERAHKGNFGRILLLAGSRGMSGAAVLAGLGALRGGAGLVRVACPAGVQPIIAAAEPGLMTVALPEDGDGKLASGAVEALGESLEWVDVLAVGPGLGLGADVRDVVEQVADAFVGPLVLDADGLNNVAPGGGAFWMRRAGRVTIITPHPGEMSRLRAGCGLAPCDAQDDDARLRCAWEFAVASGATVVLKGHATVVATGDAAYVNTSGNAGMATGGMGDVLTGLIAALLGQKLSPFDAARLAVYAHGLAADRLAKRIAPSGYLAREVADEIAPTLFEAARPPIGFAH